MLILFLFFLSIAAEYFEAMSLLEEQTIAFRHAMRTSYGNSEVTAFPRNTILLLTADDEYYLEHAGYPLKRADLARVVENLTKLGAKVVVCDFPLIFPSAYGEDVVLAKALKNSGKAVLASRLVFDRELGFISFHYPAPLLKEASESGYVNLTPTSTAISTYSRLRFYPEIASMEGGFPLAAQTAALYLDTVPKLEGGLLTIGAFKPIRLDQFDDAYIDFSSIPSKYKTIAEYCGRPLVDFLEIDASDSKRLEALKAEVEGKIVVVGDTSELSKNWYDTPVGKMKGIEILADSIATLLKGAPLRPASLWLEILLCLSVFLSILISSEFVYDPKKRALFMVVSFALYVHIATSLYVFTGVVVSMSYTLLFGLAAYFGVSLYSYVEERKVKDEIAVKLREKQKSLQKAEEKYRNIYENAAEGIFQVASDGVFVDANPAMARLMGVEDPAELVEGRWNMISRCFFEMKDGAAFFEKIRVEGNVSDLELPFRWKDDGFFPAVVSARAVKDDYGNILYYEGSMRDITERVQKEKAVGERKAAEAANKAKSEFLATMSHEIRNPLSAITAAVQSAVRSGLSEGQRNTVTAIEMACRNLTQILNNVLDLSKIEVGKLELDIRDFDLREALESVATLYREMAVAKRNELVLDIDPELPGVVRGDSSRLQQILSNLVANAVKFTERGVVAVKVDLLRKENGRFELGVSVRDTGIGIARDKAEKLFSPYTQAETSTSRKFGGTGLGLSISKKLVELMDGKIGVESELCNGSVFRFTVSLEIGLEGATDRLESPPRIRKIGVLVVDDNPYCREMLARTLQSLGCEPTVTGSVEQARDLLLDPEKSWDLVLLDHEMPGADGLAVLESIRNDLRIPRQPIVFMSAFGNQSTEEAAAEKGSNAFLFKPIMQGRLFDAILEAFDQKAPKVPRTKDPGSIEELARKIRGARILLVEDAQINRVLTKELLEGEGLSVRSVENGKQAVEAVCEEKFDAVLMDVRMPEMDGYEASRLIRKDARFQDLPIVAMSASTLAEERAKGFESGMNDYLTKPINLKKILEVLARRIDRRSEERNPDSPLNRILTTASILEQNKKNMDSAPGRSDLGYGAPPPSRMVAHLFDRLEVMLEDNNLNACDCLKSIACEIDDPDLQAALKELERHIDSLDFEKAREKLAEMAIRFEF